MSKVEIYLDNYNGVCYPSQTISGRVECFFDEKKIVRAVRIKFKGIAKTEWAQTEGKRNVRYTGEDIYFDEEYNLVTGGEEFTLHAGKHTYPFSYILPPQLPSSFEGKYGDIRYTIKATVDRPWKFDYEEKAALNVVSPLDLNYLPNLRQPISVSADKEVSGCCFNAGGSVTFKISLPVQGYAPAEKLNIGAYIQNMCNKNVERVEFKIMQKVQWITNDPYTSERYKNYTIASCTEDGIGAHGEKSWTSTITIPTEGFPNVTLCNIINITYRLEARAVLPFPHSAVVTYFPIVIGNIPLAGISTGLSGPPVQSSSYQLNSNASAPLPPGFVALPNSSAPFSSSISGDKM